MQLPKIYLELKVFVPAKLRDYAKKAEGHMVWKAGCPPWDSSQGQSQVMKFLDSSEAAGPESNLARSEQRTEVH